MKKCINKSPPTQYPPSDKCEGLLTSPLSCAVKTNENLNCFPHTWQKSIFWHNVSAKSHRVCLKGQSNISVVFLSNRTKHLAFVYLSLWQTERRGKLRLPSDGDVFAVVKLLLELEPLVVGVNHSVFVFSSCLSICKTETKHFLNCFYEKLKDAPPAGNHCKVKGGSRQFNFSRCITQLMLICVSWISEAVLAERWII